MTNERDRVPCDRESFGSLLSPCDPQDQNRQCRESSSATLEFKKLVGGTGQYLNSGAEFPGGVLGLLKVH
jgi:hypothetical protein